MVRINRLTTAYDSITTWLERVLRMDNLKRDEKVFIKLMDKDSAKYQVKNSKGEIVFKEDNDYFIYFKNANFKNGGLIDGRYLGVASDSLIDGYCRKALYIAGKWMLENSRELRTAKMVAINNKTGVTVIIQK